MFESRLKEIAKTFGENTEREKFYIIPYKQHGREIYFTNSKQAIDFMRVKFWNSLKKKRRIKRLAYLLIKLRLLQPFLKKIKLPAEMGEVIFAGGQIKGFDLQKRTVYSFPLGEKWKQSFILSKETQKKFAGMGFAPKILELNEIVPSSKEELLRSYRGNDDAGLFARLFLFYKANGISRKSAGDIMKDLKKGLKESRITNEEIRSVLNKLQKIRKKEILMARTHGDFSEEQVLQKNNDYVFTDWHSEKDLLKKEIIIGDLIKFFKKEINLADNERFKRILELYPPEVTKNLSLYIVLNEIDSIIKRGEVSPVSLGRIRLFGREF